MAATVTVASKANNLTAFLTGIANALRAKKGTTELINPQDFESEITNSTITLQNKTITPTKSEQTIRADARYDGLESVEVGAIPSEYIDTTSGTATGADILKGKTAYAKGALITGTLTVSSITIAVNGTTSSETTGTLYNEITVRVPTKGGITEISTTDEMNSLLQDETNIGKMYRYVGVTNSTYTKGDIYEVAVL